MCISYCHRRQLVYWNHDLCSEICPVADQPPGSCASCQHRQGERCSLTYAPLPEAGGCCHWNVTLVEGWVPVTARTLAPLAGLYETAGSLLADLPHRAVGNGEWAVPAECAHLLAQLGLEFRADEDGTVYFNPKELALVVREPVTDILAQFEVPYQTGGSQVLVDLAELTLPTVYGQPTEE